MLITLYVKLNKATQLCVSVQFLLLQQNTDWAISNEKNLLQAWRQGSPRLKLRIW